MDDDECFLEIGSGHPYWIQSISRGGLPKKIDIWEPNFNCEFEEYDGEGSDVGDRECGECGVK